MDKMKKPTAIAALTWLKDRCVSMKVPQSRVMVEKAIDEIEYRIPKKPDSKYDRSRHQYIPICQTCNTELDGDYTGAADKDNYDRIEVIGYIRGVHDMAEILKEVLKA